MAELVSGNVMDDLGDRTIERAAGMRLGACHECLHPHLFLLDVYGDAFAEMVLDDEVLQGVVAVLQSFLADSRLAAANGNDREEH